MATMAGDKSVYNANTNWDNEEKYLKGLANQGNAWAVDQLGALYEAKNDYSKAKDTQTDLINQLYQAQQDAATAELKAAYDQNMLAIDEAAKKIPGIYQSGRNQTAANAAVSSRNFNQYAAANGLNTGTSGQAQLAMSNQLQSGLSELDKAEAQALSDIEAQRVSTTTQYQNAVAQAIAQGELAKAQALYEEALRAEELMAQMAAAEAKNTVYYTKPKADDEIISPTPELNQKQLNVAVSNMNKYGKNAAMNIMIASVNDPHNPLTEAEADAIAAYLGW